MMQKIRLETTVPLSWAGLNWYIVMVRTGCDYHARDELEGAGLPVFMLEGRKAFRNRRVGGTRQVYDYPVFLGYLFVGDIDGLFGHLFKRGRETMVSGLVGRRGEAERVNGSVMQGLFTLHEAAYYVPTIYRDGIVPRITEGDMIEILEGPLAFMQGVIHSLKGKDHVEILAEFLGGVNRISIPVDKVSVIDV